jgi:hypothetical protein
MCLNYCSLTTGTCSQLPIPYSDSYRIVLYRIVSSRIVSSRIVRIVVRSFVRSRSTLVVVCIALQAYTFVRSCSFRSIKSVASTLLHRRRSSAARLPPAVAGPREGQHTGGRMPCARAIASAARCLALSCASLSCSFLIGAALLLCQHSRLHTAPSTEGSPSCSPSPRCSVA